MEAKTTKERVSVTEMAQICRLSRSRFQQLIGSAFPHPIYDINNRRPFYDREGQSICLEVRQRNLGVNGQPIMFYAARSPSRKANRTLNKAESPLLDGLKSLGLGTVNSAEVKEATKRLFPEGTKGVDDGDVLRKVFVFLMERRSDKPSR